MRRCGRIIALLTLRTSFKGCILVLSKSISELPPALAFSLNSSTTFIINALVALELGEWEEG